MSHERAVTTPLRTSTFESELNDAVGLNIHGFWMYDEEYLPKMRAALTEAAKVVASGTLRLPITTTYQPSQIKEAIEHSQRGGKVLLDFNHTD